jgi:nucleoside-diphosphate-sugar epimerase
VVIAVTGAATGLGADLVGRLAVNPAVAKVVAIDDRTGEDDSRDATDVLRFVRDVRDPALADWLDGVDVVVHLATDTALDAEREEQAASNVAAARGVLAAAAASGVRRVVMCTSAMVYGALPDNPVPLAEDDPLRARPDGGLLSDWLEIEGLAARAGGGVDVTVLRPAALVGPGVDTVVTRHFESPRLLVVRDTQPRWQFCHVDDLVRALELAALGCVSGSVTVGCEGWLEQSQVEQVCGLRRMEVPAQVAFGLVERLHRLGVVPTPASDLQFAVYPWVIPSTRLRAAGWRPTYDNLTALGVLLEECRGHHALAARRLGRRDAVGAAGAAVAALGTAAVVRQVRRARGRHG